MGRAGDLETPLISLRHRHEVLSRSDIYAQARSMAEATEDHSNILQQARGLRLGTWIERIQRQARKSLTGQGVKAVKDIHEKTISSLPALTGPTTYSNWEKQISKLVDSVQDGKQLTSLAYALAYNRMGVKVNLCEFQGPSCHDS